MTEDGSLRAQQRHQQALTLCAQFEMTIQSFDESLTEFSKLLNRLSSYRTLSGLHSIMDGSSHHTMESEQRQLDSAHVSLLSDMVEMDRIFERTIESFWKAMSTRFLL